MIIWEGKSKLTGEPIVAIATGLERKSKNPKTGDMVQVYILLQDIHPLKAIEENKDKSICGLCNLRPKPGQMRGKCYVNVGQAPVNVWKKYKRGGYPPLDIKAFKGKKIRWGAYGDAAFIPKSYIKRINKVSAGWTGYTHTWMMKGYEWTKDVFQASVENEGMAKAAQNRGFKTFGVELSLEYGKVCKYYEDGTDCANCLECNGTENIVVPAHGPAPVMKAWGK